MGFLSNIIQDQKQRLTNFYETEKAVIGNIANTITFGLVGEKQKIVGTSNNETLNKASEIVANNPLTSASIGAAVLNPVATVGIAKNALSTAGTAFSKASLGTKTATIIATPIIAGTLSTSKKARESVINTPSSLTNFGKDIGKVIENPSLQTAQDVLKNNPIAIGALGVAAAGLGVAAVGNTAATFLNTQAIEKNTDKTLKALEKATSGQIISTPANAPLSDSLTKLKNDDDFSVNQTGGGVSGSPLSGPNIQQINNFNGNIYIEE